MRCKKSTLPSTMKDFECFCLSRRAPRSLKRPIDTAFLYPVHPLTFSESFLFAYFFHPLRGCCFLRAASLNCISRTSWAIPGFFPLLCRSFDFCRFFFGSLQTFFLLSSPLFWGYFLRFTVVLAVSFSQFSVCDSRMSTLSIQTIILFPTVSSKFLHCVFLFLRFAIVSWSASFFIPPRCAASDLFALIKV